MKIFGKMSKIKVFPPLLYTVTVGSKIIRVLEISRVKKLIPNAVLSKQYLLSHFFRIYTVYNKHDMIKIGNQTIKKSQVISQLLE